MPNFTTQQEKIVQFLRECSGSVLSLVLTEALKDREENVKDSICESRLVLGMADRSVRDEGGWGPWNVRAIAPHDSSVYPLGNDGEPFCQYGTCPQCGLEVASHIKNALCPICEADVYLT